MRASTGDQCPEKASGAFNNLLHTPTMSQDPRDHESSASDDETNLDLEAIFLVSSH